jgi:head-tail adaptor
MIGSGDLRHRVTVQTLAERTDGHDGYDDSPVPVLSRAPAQVEPLEGRALERAQAMDPRITHRVTLRYWRNYVADLAGGRGQVVYHDVVDRTFDIAAPPIDVGERHVELQLLCKESA